MIVPDPAIQPLLLWGMPTGWEWLIIAFIAILLFGNRLPGVARSMGRGITEFKRGLRDPESDDGDGEGGADDEVPAQKEIPGESRTASEAGPSEAKAGNGGSGSA